MNSNLSKPKKFNQVFNKSTILVLSIVVIIFVLGEVAYQIGRSFGKC